MTFDTQKLEHATDREIRVAGRRFLFFGGTAYFGLNTHPEFQALFVEGVARYGMNNGTSRHNNVQLGIYDEAEKHAAGKFGFADALMLSSGYLASQLAVRALAGGGEIDSKKTVRPSAPDKPEVIYAPIAHPSLWLDERPIVPATFTDWARATVQRINQSVHHAFLVVSNTLDNVLPQRLDFSPFLEVDPRKTVHLLLDDSHGLGIFHPTQSAVHALGQQLPAHIQLTVVASMAKGLGVDAGIILSDLQTIARMRQSGIFVGASPPSPAFAYTFLHADPIYKKQWSKLGENIRFFLGELPLDRQNWVFIDDFPVFYRKGGALFEDLKAKGILISSFPYPNPTHAPVDRIVLSAAHQQEDIAQLAALLSPDG